MSAVARTERVLPLSDDGVVPPRLVEELADRLFSRLADRLANRLLATVAATSVAAVRDDGGGPRIPDGATYATASQLAARFQLSVQWVHSHAADLGATPISDSPNSKVRYHIATADAYMARRRIVPKTTSRSPGGRRPRPTPRTHTRSGHPLLDVI
jgi:hypothetical protein